MSVDLTRRDFIKRAAQGTAAGLAFSAARPAVAASDKVRVGVIGPGRQGRGDMNNFVKQPDVEIVAVCDVYEPNLQLALEIAGSQAQTYKDFRQVLERKDIDAVLVGTPDHWHSLVTVEACKAGKDVYVEKPLSHDIHEGQVVVEAARKYNRVVQLGTQQRSGIHFQKAAEIVRSGAFGQDQFCAHVELRQQLSLWALAILRTPNRLPDWTGTSGSARRPRCPLISTAGWVWTRRVGRPSAIFGITPGE